MGVLLPESFSLSELKNEAERTVVRALCDRLLDGWIVIPSLRSFGEARDHEMDVVLLHADAVALIEVKGYRPACVNGSWSVNGAPVGRPPYVQASENAYELRRRLRGIHPTLAQVEVPFAVAFPNVAELAGRLPPGVDRTQFWTAPDIDNCQDALDLLIARRPSVARPGEHGVRAILDTLLPSCEFIYDPEARARRARQRLDQIGAERTEALESLDANRLVCVTGAAGTGKTRLAVGWTQRALRRGERVLLTCFNVPLAAWLRNQFEPDDPNLVVGEFHRVARHLAGMPTLEQPADADRTWWDTVEYGHLDANWHLVTERFDTVVIDEAQDLRPSWIALLQRLLGADGARRMLLVADTSQVISPRGFEVPRAEDGWTLAELTANCRNTFEIAALLRRHFAGAVAPVAGPESEDVRWVDADDVDRQVAAVGDAIDAIEAREHGAETVLVATFTSAVRDRLRDEYALVAWEQRTPGAILGENVQRIKGLQYDHVVLVVHDEHVSDDLLSIGISRAVMSLVVIGPAAVGHRLGLCQPPGGR